MAGGLSNYSRNGLIGLALGGTTFARAATVYAEPYETDGNPDAEGDGGDVPDSGYSARASITNNNTNFPAADGKAKTLAPAVVLYTATGAESLVGVALWDATTDGNMLALFEPAAPVVTSNGKRIKIKAGTLTLATTGAWVTAFGNALLNHLLGGGDYTPEATLYIGLIATGTTELSGDGYARVAKTNDTTNFLEPVDGVVKNGTEIEFGPATDDWTEATRVGIYTASSGGTLLAVADLDAPVTVLDEETATFDAETLEFELATDVTA